MLSITIPHQAHLPASLDLLQRSDHLPHRMPALRHNSAISKYDFIFGSVWISGGRSSVSVGQRLRRRRRLRKPLPQRRRQRKPRPRRQQQRRSLPSRRPLPWRPKRLPPGRQLLLLIRDSLRHGHLAVGNPASVNRIPQPDRKPGSRDRTVFQVLHVQND